MPNKAITKRHDDQGRMTWRHPYVLSVILAAVLSVGGLIGAAEITKTNPQSTKTNPQPGDTSLPPLPTDATPLELQINNANILLAGTSTARVAEVRGFFRKDPALQALASDCITLLSGKRFIYTVHLDVINGKYKALIDPNVPYLQPDQYHDLPKLKVAILTHWNELYPDHHAVSLDQIVK